MDRSWKKETWPSKRSNKIWTFLQFFSWFFPEWYLKQSKFLHHCTQWIETLHISLQTPYEHEPFWKKSGKTTIFLDVFDGQVSFFKNGPGWFHVKSQKKHDQFFFGFLTLKVKGIRYFSDKNNFSEKFCWFLTIFWIWRNSVFRVWQLSTLVPIKLLVSSLTELTAYSLPNVEF